MKPISEHNIEIYDWYRNVVLLKIPHSKYLCSGSCIIWKEIWLQNCLITRTIVPLPPWVIYQITLRSLSVVLLKSKCYNRYWKRDGTLGTEHFTQKENVINVWNAHSKRTVFLEDLKKVGDVILSTVPIITMSLQPILECRIVDDNIANLLLQESRHPTHLIIRVIIKSSIISIILYNKPLQLKSIYKNKLWNLDERERYIYFYFHYTK